MIKIVALVAWTIFVAWFFYSSGHMRGEAAGIHWATEQLKAERR